MNTTQAKERPIIFSAPMVRAILDGRKTQTRRIVKPPYEESPLSPFQDGNGRWLVAGGLGTLQGCPYGQPGDLLWVREAWCPHPGHPRTRVAYRAEGASYGLNNGNAWGATFDDGATVCRSPEHPDKPFGEVWRSPIHMPRWASRLTLRVTDVRVERLHDISEADALAEGGKSHYCSPEDTAECEPGTPERALAEILEGGFLTAKSDFISRWDKLNGKKPGGSWADNPWVWVVSFERVDVAG